MAGVVTASLRARVGGARRRLGLAAAVARAPFGSADLAVFHQLEPAPSGGGHQFIRALIGELEGRGIRVERNRLSAGTPACLFNSFNFDPERLRRLRHAGSRCVHRVDGPIAVYRGTDDGSDERIAALNAELADATIFQSRYSLEESASRGLEFRTPVVIPNAVDARIFHPSVRPRRRGKRLRLVTTSWSPNPRKGGATYRWLAEHLDPERYEYTFVGVATEELPGVTVVPPVSTREVAEILREHDVFVTASLHESCSNALLEGLACGLPALYVDSGSNGELAKDGGVPFRSTDDLLEALERVSDRYEELRGRIEVASLSEVAARYLEVLQSS